MIGLSWKYNKARIWLDELPPWKCQETQVFELLQEELEMRLPDVRCAAVELLLPTGGRAYYGALGAQFVPRPIRQLSIHVLISSNEGPIIHDALAGSYDTVRCGLPLEYLRGVIDYAKNPAEAHLLGSGTLRFCCATHGSPGSSVRMFRVLTDIVIKLLLLERGDAPEERLIGLIRSELVKQGMKEPRMGDSPY